MQISLLIKTIQPDISTYVIVCTKGTGAEKGQSKNIVQILKKYFLNRNIFSQVTVEKSDKSTKLWNILRKSVDPQITFSINWKYFAHPYKLVQIAIVVVSVLFNKSDD